ncbi:MAG: alpha/beta hydrolase [Hyphomicrobiaceae bacterium]
MARREIGNGKSKDWKAMSAAVFVWLIAGLILCAVLFLGVRRIEHVLLYAPDTQRTMPESVGLGDVVDEIVLPTPDGETVIAWYLAAKLDRPTVLYFHGNGASLANRADRIARFANAGIGVFMMTYRGYGGSSGTASEVANVQDAVQAYNHVRGLGVAASDIILYGESLGSGVATQVAAHPEIANEIGGLVLDAPYTAIVDVAALHYPYLPARLLMRDRYETMRYIGKVGVPVLVLHGEADGVIPVEMGRAVAAALPGQAELKTFPGAGHTNHDEFGSFEAMLGWLERIRSARKSHRSERSLSASG